MAFVFTLLRLRNKFCFCLRIKSSVLTIFTIVLFVSLSITIGVLTVYFTSPKQSKTCQLTFKRIGKSSITISSQPRSIAIGDFNNDNQMDIVVANSGTNNIGILLLKIDGTFSNQQTYPTGIYSRPYSVVVNDFNNDNYLDIAVANYGTNNIGIFLGYGNGSFANQKLFSTGSSHPLFIVTDDFNKDNRSDIAVVNYGTDSISIFLGYGNGSFHMQKMYSTGYDSFPFSLSIGDFNNDDRLDIAVTNYDTDNIGILLGYGNGSFSNQQIYPTTYGSNPSSVAVGDINNDNYQDIVFVNNGTNNIGILLGVGNGTFSVQNTYSIDSNFRPQYIAIGNFDEDGKLDVVVDDSENDEIHILSIYDNNTFTSVTTYYAISGSHPSFINVADLNNDNQSDIIVTNYGTNGILVLIGYSNVPSARQKNYIFGDEYRPGSIVISNFNNDSHLDIAVTGIISSGIFLIMGYSDQTFVEGKTFSTGNGSFPQQICGNDLNNDNRIDIISANLGTDSVGILLGLDHGIFANVTTYSTGIGSSPRRLAVGDVNNDNRLDIITANDGTDSVGILLGNGDGSFATVLTFSTGTGSGPFSVAIGDVNNDNYLDIVTADYTSNCISILFGDGNGTFGMLSIYSVGYISGPLSIAVADFNSDNYLDIVIANFDAGNVGILLGSSNGIFRTQTTYSTGSGSSPIYVMIDDFNHDKRLDIAITLFGSGEVVIFFGYGNGNFELSRKYFTGSGSQPYDIVFADINNDNQSEIVVTLSGLGEIAVLTEYFAAQFANETTYSTGSAPQPSSIAIGDLNNDNRSDIVVANSGTDNLGIDFGLGNGTFQSEIMYSTGIDSHPQYVIIADINKDNYLDIISVNSELDSISLIIGYGNGSLADQIIYSTGNGSHPSAVVFGDFNNDNRSDLITANEGTDSITILIGYDYALFQSQRIYQSTNDLGPYGIVTNDFNNDSHLDIAVAFFNSSNVGILLGYGNGSFSVMMTYPQWIDSAIIALAVDDINNDDRLDIVIVDYGTNNIIILLGYGNGSFLNSMAFSTGNHSGPSAIVIADFNNDDRLDVAVTNCDGSNLGIFLGYGNGSFATIVTYPIGYHSCPVAINVNDFNKDNRLDIVVVNRDASNLGIFLGYGNGSFANQVTYSTGSYSQPQSIIVTDINDDGELDIFIVIYNFNTVGYFQGNGNGTFAFMREFSVGSLSAPHYIADGDFNNDNQLDMIIVNSESNSIIIFFGYGHEAFYVGRTYSTGIGSGPIELAIGDFNNDNRLDFVVTNYLSNDIDIFLGYGSEPFGGITTSVVSFGSQPRALAIGHFNSDSLLDVVLANYGTNNIGILLGNGDGTFSTMLPYPTGIGSAPCSIAVGQFNNDNHSDIVVVNCETDNLVIFLGFGNGTFATGANYSTGSHSLPYSIAIADLNNNNIMDIIVANSGTNNVLLLYGYGNGTFGNEESYILGYDYRPHSVAVNDLNQDGWMDIVIACYNTDNVEILMKMC